MRERGTLLSYPIDVLLHLMRNYLVVGMGYPLLMVPFLIVSAFSGSFQEVANGWASLFTQGWLFLFGCVHLMVFVLFPYYFSPRFPGAPVAVTFGLAALYGAVLLTALWTFDASPNGWTLEAVDAFPAWAGSHADVVVRRLTAGIGLTVAGGLLGFAVHAIAGSGGVTWGLGKWAGYLIVGRTRFDAIIAQEVARLRREYDAYRKEISQ